MIVYSGWDAQADNMVTEGPCHLHQASFELGADSMPEQVV